MAFYAPDPPPPPDYSALAATSKEQADKSYALAKEQFDWAKGVYDSNKPMIDKITKQQADAGDFALQNAKDDRARYQAKYQPLEDQLISDAQSYDSPERQRAEAGKSEALVHQQFNGQREAALRNLEGYGVDPTSTRYAALDIGVRTNEAAAQAAAGNTAIQNTGATGRALRADAINIGKGMGANVNAEMTAGVGAGTAGISGMNSTSTTGAATMGTGTQWAATGNGALGTAANIQNMSYQNQLGYYNAQNSSSSGLGSLFGAGLGLMTTPLQGTMLAALADGGVVPEGPSTGGAIPAAASPSGGAATDDVQARLNVGEFVIPKDVVDWIGKKGAYQLVAKARKEQQELPQQSGAIPAVRPARPQAPTFSTQGAI